MALGGESSYSFGEGSECEVGSVKSIGRKGVVSHLMCDIGRKTELGILVETFEKRNTHGVGEGPVRGLVACEIGVKICMLKKLACLRRHTVDEQVFVGIETKSVYE